MSQQNPSHEDAQCHQPLESKCRTTKAQVYTLSKFMLPGGKKLLEEGI